MRGKWVLHKMQRFCVVRHSMFASMIRIFSSGLKIKSWQAMQQRLLTFENKTNSWMLYLLKGKVVKFVQRPRYGSKEPSMVKWWSGNTGLKRIGNFMVILDLKRFQTQRTRNDVWYFFDRSYRGLGPDTRQKGEHDGYCIQHHLWFEQVGQLPQWVCIRSYWDNKFRVWWIENAVNIAVKHCMAVVH